MLARIKSKFVSIQKWLFSPISLLGGNFNPRDINHMPAVKISARLELNENISFLDGHKFPSYWRSRTAAPMEDRRSMHRP
jgi:hypothetical protein